MKRIGHTAVFVLAIGIASLTAPGCGSSDNVWISGKLLKGGVAYAPPGGQRVGLTLHAVEGPSAVASGTSYPARYIPEDGTFDVPGPDGQGIPPGKYRVAISQKMKRDSLPSPRQPRGIPFDRDTDFLEAKFGPAMSPILRELTSSGELVIDLNSPG